MSSVSLKSLKKICLHILNCENLIGEKRGAWIWIHLALFLLTGQLLCFDFFPPHVWELFWTDRNVKG